MAEVQFDEFNQDTLGSFWEALEPSYGDAFHTFAGGQLNMTAPGPGTGYRIIRQEPINVDLPFDVYSRITVPRVVPAPAAPWPWHGGGLGLWGNLDGVDIFFQWNKWLGTWGLMIYADGWNNSTAEFIEENIDVESQLDPDFLTAWVRIQHTPLAAVRMFYALREPFVETDWTEKILPFTEAPVVEGPGATLDLFFGGQGVQFPATTQIDYARSWPRSGLKSDQLADLDDIFYNLDEFAENVIYLPRGGSQQSIKAVILDQDGSLSEGYALADTLNIRVQSADVYQPGRDAVFINGEKWNVLRNVSGGPSIGEWELEISRADKRVL